MLCFLRQSCFFFNFLILALRILNDHRDVLNLVDENTQPQNVILIVPRCFFFVFFFNEFRSSNSVFVEGDIFRLIFLKHV